MTEPKPWYPKETKRLFKEKRDKRGLCYICSGKGLLNDLKTGKERACVACKGIGRIKAK